MMVSVRKNRRFLFFCFCGALMIGTSSVPNSSQAADDATNAYMAEMAGSGNLVINVDLVNVLFTLTDRNGRFVTTADKGQLKIFEDNRLQTITNFSRETDLPLTIGILLDTSSSIHDHFRFEQEAAIDFLTKSIRRGKDKAFFVTFDSAIDLAQDFTDDSSALAHAIHQAQPGGGTKLYDSIFLVCQEKLKSETGRKVLILISDGNDNLSIQTLASALEIAQKADVVIYAISTNSDGLSGKVSSKYDLVLKRLAEDTGGKAFFPTKVQDLAENFRNISNELRSQYSLAYRSSNPMRDGTFRSIKIQPANQGLKVKARKGYYAPRG
jgi:Ca-activated chloride channel homolog